MKYFNQVLLSFLLGIFINAYSQNTTFLTLPVPPSSYLNGQGSTGNSVLTDDPFAFASNPAQLGSWSKTNNIATHFYTTKTDWFLDKYLYMNMTYNNQAFAVGMNFKQVLSNIDVSVGLGYINSVFDYGKFSMTTEQGPDVKYTFDESDIYRAYSIGLGIHSFIDLSLGYTLKHINPNHADNPEYYRETGCNDAKANYYDLGALLNVPVHNFILPKGVEIGADHYAPFFNISMGITRANQGDKLNFGDQQQSDAGPRLASLGYSINFGTDAIFNNQEIKLLSITWTTEAERILVVNNQTGNSEYISGLGGISVIRNLIEREGDMDITCKHGFGVEIGEFFILSRGSFAGGAYDFTKTYGFSVKAGGFVKLLNVLVQSQTLNYIANHFDIQYHQSTQYWNDWPGMDYNGIVLLVRGFTFDHGFSLK
jgi:hypothetical protein